MRALLAFDASAGAQQAAALVAALRWPSNSLVRIVAVIEPFASLVPMAQTGLVPPRLVTSPEIDAELTDHLEAEVATWSARLESAGLQVEGAVLRGRPATVIADEALTFGADVVVVGSRGHGSIASLLLGSVSAELVDVAPCPVLVARRPHVQRVLLGTDGSPSAARAERLLAEWAWFEGVARRVISVAEVVRPWHTGIAPSIYSQVMAAEAKDLEAATARHLGIAQESAQRLAAVGREAEVSVPVGDPAAAIIAESEAWNADLVVLGSRGQTGLARLVLGSVARNVLHGTTCSVLVVRDRST